MFSNVGMNPYGPAGVVVTSKPQTTVSPNDPARPVAPTVRGESAASGQRPATPVMVDPVRQALAGARLRDGERKETDAPDKMPGSQAAVPTSIFETPEALLRATLDPPPDPDAPVGPPPSFEISPLEASQRDAQAETPEPAETLASDAVLPERIDAAPDARPDLPGARAGEASETSVGPDALEDVIRNLVAQSLRIEVPPSPEIRAETGFGDVRRIGESVQGKEVDRSA